MKKHFILYLITAVVLCVFVIVFVGCDNHSDVSNTELQGADIESTVFKITGNELYTKVSNSTQTFAFSNAINVAQNATYTVSTDNKGERIIRSKTVELNVGDNKYYIIVENGNDAAIYVVTIRRKPVYVVNFVGNKNTVLSKQIEEDDKVTEPTEVSIKGYEYNGWTFDFATPITCNTTIYANLDKPIVYKTYYDLNDEKFVYKAQNNNNLQECTIKDTPKTPSAKGYLFKGWTSFFDDVKKIAYFGALWEPIKYNITYDFNDEKSVSKVLAKNNYPKYYTVESEIVFKDPERKGYNLISWDAHTIKKGSIGDIHIVAEWEVIEYSITYLLNDEELPQKAENAPANPQTYTIEDTVVLDKPKCIGYGFFGWYKDNEEGEYIPEVSAGSTEDYILYAVWGTSGITVSDGVATFSGKAKRVIIPKRSNGQYVIGIGGYAFSNCDSLTSIIIPDSVLNIGTYAFNNCSRLTSLTISVGVTSIGDFAFRNCSNLINIYYLGDVASWCGISGLGALMSSSRTLYIGGNKVEGDLVIPDGVTCIGDSAFNGRTDLTSIAIPNSVTSIGKYAFYGCSRLASITIPDNVTSIGDSVFNGCSKLASVTFGNGVTSISSSAFENCTDLTSMTIPNSVISIGGLAFYGCTGLSSITIGDRVTDIRYGAFIDCSSLKDVTIPNSVTSISDSVFRGCSSLESITLPFVGKCVMADDGYDQVFGYIFGYFSANSSTVDTEATYQYYDGAVYYHYYIPSSIKSVTVTKESIPGRAFYNCSNITSVVIPDNTTSISYEAFSGCRGLTSVTIPDSVTSIGNYAFKYCSGLTSVTIPDSVTSIGRSAFESCSGITSIIIPNGVKSICDYTFYHCDSLKNVFIGNGVKSIGQNAFYYSRSLTSITIPNSVTSINNNAFYTFSEIVYGGTMEQWNAIEKRTEWDGNCYSYTVKCTDGNIKHIG